MDDDRLLRDVVIAMDARFHPQHAFVNLVKDGAFMGSGWFRFAGGLAECCAETAAEGRIHQEISVTAPVRFFGTHPIVCDGLMPALFDPKRSERRQRISAFASSLAPNGASGPMLCRLDMDIEYVGEEKVEVAAGAFNARCFHVHLPGAFSEPLRIWTHGADSVVVKESWTLLKSRYELVEFSDR